LSLHHLELQAYCDKKQPLLPALAVRAAIPSTLPQGMRNIINEGEYL
jgi:hypothetical protein